MGLVHIYCGDGKGKTTCSVGLALRFAGAGGNVLYCQFMKDGRSNELNILSEISGIDVFDTYKLDKFSFRMNEAEKAEASEKYNKDIRNIVGKLSSGKYGMVILDEIMSCISNGFVSESVIVDLIKDMGRDLEIVMTGRDPGKALTELADYISEINCVRHPYQKNISARKGIEY